MTILDNSIRGHLDFLVKKIEDELNAAVASYVGPIDPSLLKLFQGLIEQLKASNPDKTTMALIIQSPGGNVEAAEKMVEIMRHHFNEVYFIVPEMAMSAGTILCMSGDKIYMNYASSLGPIDPQVQGSDGHWVPALGYLDQFEKLIDKSKTNSLTTAEYGLIQSFDLARLRRFEQARDLSITLLKEWLVQYKFKDWTIHRTDPAKHNQLVTDNERKERAEEIARQLGDHNYWHSHSRMISLKTLQENLRLEIDDYSSNSDLAEAVANYYDLLLDYINRNGSKILCHGRGFF